VFLPGIMFDAGGFTFGHDKRKEFSNQHIHFYISIISGSHGETIHDALNGVNCN